MKRKFAVIMSAALAAGSTMPVMAESETAFTPSTYVGEFSLTADGESMLFSITAEQFAEDGVSVSANVTLPPSVTGEEADTVYGLNDVLRVVSGDLYINVAEIASTYGELLGSDISSMLPMFGIDQDWVEIPAIDFAAVETEAETDFDVDLNGKGCSANVVSRSVARDQSRQEFYSTINGNNECKGHSECDAIIMDSASVSASPKLTANNIDANLIHEAAIGKIAGEQLIKLMTLGLTEAEAEEQIINGFLK